MYIYSCPHDIMCMLSNIQVCCAASSVFCVFVLYLEEDSSIARAGQIKQKTLFPMVLRIVVI